MVESLTTKNLEIGERCGELEATIADLESSVEMSEELETQQAEDIRELQVSHNINGGALRWGTSRFAKGANDPTQRAIVPGRHADVNGVLKGSLLFCKRLGFALTPNTVIFGPQTELTGREVSLHNQKLALESVIKELQDAKQTIDRFRCALFVAGTVCRRLLMPAAPS